MVSGFIEDLKILSEMEEKSVEMYSEQFDNFFVGGGRVDWQKVSETKNLITYHEGRKSIVDEILSQNQK